MKKSKTTKRLASLLLALVMILSMSITVFASEAGGTDVTTEPQTYFIKITAPDAETNHVFNAYQIFSGTLSSTNTLTDVDWGSGIDEEKISDLYTALKEIEITDSSNSKTTFPFAAMSQDTAASVSDILASYNDNTELVKAFQDLITKKGTDSDTYIYLSGTFKNIAKVDDQDGSYIAEGVSAGYYVIVDEKLEQSNIADIMLQVVGDVDVTAKMDIPSVKKYAGKEDVSDNATFSVGDEIPYTLIGTIPNYTNNGYTYQFTDTMDEALDLDYIPSASNSEQVERGVTVTIDGNTNLDITNYFLITYKDHVLTIKSKQDLNDYNKAAANDADKLTADREIHVTYNAKVNIAITDHVINNTVVVESQMGEDGYTTTPVIQEQVYPITLEITKVDGDNNSITESAAEFQLYRKVNDDDGNPTIIEYATTNASGQFTGWTTTEADAAVLTTDGEGKISLTGIGAGIFYLKETQAPSGYNKLTEDKEITIQSESETSASGTIQLKTLKYSLDQSAMITDGVDIDNGTISISIVNQKGATLPTTGGTGTTIFYIVGGILVIGAAVLLIAKKRMHSENL